MVEIVWTEVAIDDLRSIHDYVSKDSAIYAERLIEKLIARVEQLNQFPNAGRVVPEFDSPVIRELIEGNYRIIYQINSQVVFIIRIHHSARLLR